MSTRLIFAALLLLIIQLAWAQPAIFPQPLSPRIASYDIQVTLDADKKRLAGRETLTWRNASADTIRELPFHLYLNAFKNTRSTFMRESGGQLRGDRIDTDNTGSWGWIEVNTLKIRNGADLTSQMRFIHPDDDNADDQTVLQVPLDKPLLPGETIQVDMAFSAKLPQIFARTGFSDNYFLVGQWFPKIGVYEQAGQRYAKQGQWNCHQFHANSEFYADFGVYDVQITLPENFVVGATGLLQTEKTNNGTKTLTYHAEDVIDFAWTASPRFQVVEDKWQQVSIKVLLQPEHLNQADRHVQSAKAALAYFDKYVGKYPYPNLTIVDPPFRGSGSGGMEYPTFITAGTFWGLPEGLRAVEGVTVHEFGHQYFMQLLASNEFEEPWLDEGFNSYVETRIMDATYGEKTSAINLFGYRAGDTEFSRNGYVGIENPGIAPNFRYAWQFTDGGYSSLTYSKTATWMHTLDRLVGRRVMDEILQTYFARWKFKHPCATDFIAIVNEITRKRHGNRFGENMQWFFDQVLYGSGICDYKLASVTVNEITQSQGVTERNGKKITLDADENSVQPYRSKVTVHRLGEVTMPVEILVHFADGSEIKETWDGQSPTQSFTYDKPQKVTWAIVDPQQKLLIDVNLTNNSYAVRSPQAPLYKYFVKFLFWVQNAMQFLG